MSSRMVVNAPQQICKISLHTENYAGFCGGCRREVEMVGFSEAALITGANFDELISRTAGGQIHLGIKPESLLLCLESLLAVDFRRETDLPDKDEKIIPAHSDFFRGAVKEFKE